MPLTDIAARNTKPAEKIRKLSDGGGLQLRRLVFGQDLDLIKAANQSQRVELSALRHHGRSESHDCKR